MGVSTDASGLYERVHTARRAALASSGSPESGMEAAVRTFQIGQRVRVAKRCEYYADWEKARLEIASVQRDREGRISYGTFDLDYPNDGMTTDWPEDDLVIDARSKTAPAPSDGQDTR